MPAGIDGRIVLGTRLVAFFTANPGVEVASMNVTAAHGTTLGSAVQTAKQALAAAEVALTDANEARDAAWTTMTTVMRMLSGILKGLLSRTDARWLAFGLNIPASNTTPGEPGNLTAHGDGLGTIVVQCDAVPLATRYRWRTRIVGGQGDYALAASTVDPMAPLSGFPPGVTVEIIVQAVNVQQQGVASEPIAFTVPPSVPRVEQPAATAVAAAPVGAVEAVAAGVAKTGGNGEAHGNGNGGGNGHGPPPARAFAGEVACVSHRRGAILRVCLCRCRVDRLFIRPRYASASSAAWSMVTSRFCREPSRGMH